MIYLPCHPHCKILIQIFHLSKYLKSLANVNFLIEGIPSVFLIPHHFLKRNGIVRPLENVKPGFLTQYMTIGWQSLREPLN